jgi:hypothetical protein
VHEVTPSSLAEQIRLEQAEPRPALNSRHRVDAPRGRSESEHLELPVEELLRRARRLPPHDQMIIEDLSEAEGADFVAAVDS